jgi:TonB family protein
MGCVALLFSTLQAQTTPPGREILNAGVSEFKQGNYVLATKDFRQAVAADPQNVNAHLYLATAISSQYIPGSEMPEQTRLADEALAEFQTALTLEPTNLLATSSIASLYYNQRKYDEAGEWNQKVIALDPDNKQAYYTLGVIAWNKFLPVDRQAREESHQNAPDPGPIANATIRQQLKPTWLPVLDDGIANMRKALEIDPQYDDAMAYMNLLIRYRGDLLDSPEAWSGATEEADQWMQKALDAKRLKKQNEVPAGAPSPPPPTRLGVTGTLRIGGEVMKANLINRVDPHYPPLARAAGISGTVLFAVDIGRDGSVENLRLISGHPLLVSAAREAVAQYVYKPTLLNGQAVEVNTTVEVLFENP